MLNYILMKNHLVTDPSKYVANVSSPVNKNLNDILSVMIAEGTGLTRPQALAYFEKLTQTVLQFLNEGHCVSTPLFKVRPTITGLFDSKEDSFDTNRHKIKIRMIPGARISKLTTTIQANKCLANPQIPFLSTFVDAASGQKDSYATSGGIGVLYGDELKFNPSESNQGVFFVAVNNPTIQVRAAVYSKVNKKEVHFVIPTLAEGDYTLKVSAATSDGKLINTGVMKAAITA